MTGTAILPDRSDQGMDLFAAAAARFTNVATSFLRSGSLISEAALLGPTHWTILCSDSDLALPLHEQWEDSDLASRLHARFVERLPVGEKTQRLGDDLTSYPCLFERFASCRLRGP
jgi:hypothetical protein